jgi:hypothetical protein
MTVTTEKTVRRNRQKGQLKETDRKKVSLLEVKNSTINLFLTLPHERFESHDGGCLFIGPFKKLSTDSKTVQTLFKFGLFLAKH